MCEARKGKWQTSKLTEGILNEGRLDVDFFLENGGKLKKLLRRANVALRWLLLHTTTERGVLAPPAEAKKLRLLRELVIKESGVGQAELFKALVVTAQLEQRFKDGLRHEAPHVLVKEVQKSRFLQGRPE